MGTPIIAVVVTYHPGPDIRQNIMSYDDFADHIIIVDNTEGPDDTLTTLFGGDSRVTCIINGENTGISRALNIASAYAIRHNYEWLLTMDQDSSFSPQAISAYRDCFEKVKNEKLGMLGVNYSDPELAIQPGACTPEKKDSVITSGSLINLAAYLKTGPFNEDLFIDGVDDEYCFRLTLNGFEVIQLDNIHLTHALGKTILSRQLLIGKKVNRNVHAPVRIYYMARNYLYLIKKYRGHFPEKSKAFRKMLFNKLKNGIVYGNKRIQTLGYFLKGVFHFYTSRMGKL